MCMNIVLMITTLIFARKHVQLRTTHFTHFLWPGFYGIYKEGAFMLRNCETVCVLSRFSIKFIEAPKHYTTAHCFTLASGMRCMGS